MEIKNQKLHDFSGTQLKDLIKVSAHALKGKNLKVWGFRNGTKLSETIDLDEFTFQNYIELQYEPISFGWDDNNNFILNWGWMTVNRQKEVREQLFMSFVENALIEEKETIELMKSMNGGNK